VLPHEEAAAAAIRRVYERPVQYTGAGLVSATVSAIRADTPGSDYQGYEGRSRSVCFEVFKTDLPGEPDKGDLIVEGSGTRWSVIDRDENDDVGAWVLFVEQAPPA
jgi:hypothetical protein